MADASVSTANAQAQSNVVLEYYFMIVPVTATGTATVSVNIAASGGVTASNVGADNIAYLQFANTGRILGSACSGEPKSWSIEAAGHTRSISIAFALSRGYRTAEVYARSAAGAPLADH